VNRSIVAALLGALFVLGGCERSLTSPSEDAAALARAPANGHGNKQVFLIDETEPVSCGGGLTLSAHAEGWFQIRVFEQPGNRNVELDIFHATITYTNVDGETFRFQDVGPDHYYIEDGNLIVAVTGRSSASGVIGHFVLNLDTNEVELIAGNEFGSPDALACEALA
jgi:hypothetical protein